MKLLLFCGLVHALVCGTLSLTLRTTLSPTLSTPHENEIQEHVHVVKTKYGPVDGINVNSYTNKNVIAYYGLPYAQPPTGENRFRPPVHLENKVAEEVFHADHIPLPCYQNPTVTGRSSGLYVKRPWSEDCLKLNIWLPNAEVKEAPVVVYFHAGGFYMGTAVSERANGATLASEENIIVVNVAYRLGALGFLTLGTDEAPGNMGLMDQQMALKWVHENIAAFGGNPNSVTLLGFSSGGASVGYHLLAPSSHGLFQRAILMSGVPTNPWATHSKESVIRKTKKIANELGYHGDENPEHILAFLRAQNVEDIIDHNGFHDLLSEDVIAPTIDGHFITDNPHHLLHNHESDKNVNVMIGNTADEGAALMVAANYHLFKDNPNGAISKEDFLHIVSNADSHGIDSWVTGAVVNNYVDHTREGDAYMYRDQAKKAVSDYLFNCDTESFADHLAKDGHKVYRYIYDGEYRDWRETGNWLGTVHGSDIPIVFGLGFRAAHLPQEYGDFIKNVMHHYGNFIKTGDPNTAGEHDKLVWPAYNLEDRSVKVIKPGNCSIEHHPGVYHCAVMRYLIPMVSKIGHCQRGEKHHGLDHEKGHHPHHHEE